jgi:hypothetical protein
MTVLHMFWLPILLSSVFVFVASALIHMVLFGWHKSDYGKAPQEDKVMDALRPFSTPPGDYMMPNCSSPSEMRTEEFKEKMRKGPVIIFTVFPNGMMGIGRNLVLWFLYLLVVNFFTGFVACHAIPFWLGHRSVFHIVGATSFLGYTAALWQLSIWYRRSWVTTIKATVDGLIYAAVTAATFGWLWPR